SKANLARHRSPSSPATVRSHGPRAAAARREARIGVRVGSRFLPAAGRRKAASEPSANPDQLSAPPSIGHLVATTRYLNKHARPPALPPGVRADARVDRNWPAEIGATVQSPEVLPAAQPSTAPPPHSKR